MNANTAELDMEINTLIVRHNKAPSWHISHNNFKVYLRLDDGSEHEIPSVVSYETGVNQTGTPRLISLNIYEQAFVIL